MRGACFTCLIIIQTFVKIHSASKHLKVHQNQPKEVTLVISGIFVTNFKWRDTGRTYMCEELLTPSSNILF